MSSKLCGFSFRTPIGSSHAQSCCNKFVVTETAIRAAVASTITLWHSVTSWRRIQAVRPISEQYLISGISSHFSGFDLLLPQNKKGAAWSSLLRLPKDQGKTAQWHSRLASSASSAQTSTRWPVLSCPCKEGRGFSRIPAGRESRLTFSRLAFKPRRPV